METLLSILNISFISILCFWYWKKQELPVRKFYWHALAAKLSAGLLVGIIHAVAYADSDTFVLFEMSKELSLMARTDFGTYLKYLWDSGSAGYFSGMDRTVFFVKIISIVAFITYDSYWISCLYFSLISFFAAWRLTKIIWEQSPELGIVSAIAFLFFPSCVFWASGILKEALAMAGLYFLAGVFLELWWKQKFSTLNILTSVVVIWITWSLKYYYVGLFVPILFSSWLTKKIVEWKDIKKFSVEISLLFSLLIITLLLASFVHPNFSFSKILTVLVSNNEALVQLSDPGNVIHYYQLKDTWLSFFLNSPLALISGLFRPFIWEANSFLKFGVSVENLVLLVLVILSLRFIARIKNSPDRLLIIGIMLYCALLCIFLAISTPNFGTLVRYRVGFLPFLLLLLLSRPVIVRVLAKLFNVQISGLSG